MTVSIIITNSLLHIYFQILLEVTDSWYSIKAQIDVPLTDLVRQGQITVGQKLCVSGAELIGAEDACSPLEVNMRRVMRNPMFWFPTWSDTKQAVQLQKMA